jgi:S1-C subfamily serine protease
VAVADSALTVSEEEFNQGVGALTARFDEPVGLSAAKKNPKLGLEAGDIVRAIDGEPALVTTRGKNLGLIATRRHLDVRRGSRDLIIEVRIKNAPVDHPIMRSAFVEILAAQRRTGNPALVQVTKAQKPSGVLVTFLFLGAPVPGDIIRSVNGKATSTIDSFLSTALEAAATNPKVTIEAEHDGQPVTYAFTLLAAAEDIPVVAETNVAIHKIDDTTFEVPRELGQMLQTNTTIAKPRIVNAVTDGKPDGIKLFTIRSNSVFGRLGMQNGDIVHSVGGFPIVSGDDLFIVLRELDPNAKIIRVELTRQGKPMTLEYRIQ